MCVSAVLVQGLLGHEWDEDIDNGFRPPGLMHLSSTTVDNVQYIMDEGATYDTGSATHHLTLYRHVGGALVFGGGTCQWSWGLDGHHDGVGGIDLQMGKNCYRCLHSVCSRGAQYATEGAVRQRRAARK